MKIRLEMHVVPNDSMPMDIIIGSDILEHAELTIRQDRVSISKIVRDKDYCNVFLTQMQILPDFRVDVDHIEDRPTRVQIKDLVTSYKPNKTKITETTMNIIVKEERSIYRPCRLPLLEREIVDRQIDEWLKDGVIEECSSDYASTVVVIKKKDGRVCIDYRKINA